MPTPNLDAATLAATRARLQERADQITLITLRDLVEGLRVAARCCDALVLIRTELSQIVGRCQDSEAARELRDLLSDVEG